MRLYCKELWFGQRVAYDWWVMDVPMTAPWPRSGSCDGDHATLPNHVSSQCTTRLCACCVAPWGSTLYGEGMHPLIHPALLSPPLPLLLFRR